MNAPEANVKIFDGPAMSGRVDILTNFSLTSSQTQGSVGYPQANEGHIIYTH